MVFWVYGDQLVVLVNFHKTTMTTHRLVCGLISWKERKRNCNILFSVQTVTQGHIHRGPSLRLLMLWIQDTLAPQLNKLCTLCISTKHSNCEIIAEPSLICCSLCLEGLLRLVLNQGNQRKRWAETGTQGDQTVVGKHLHLEEEGGYSEAQERQEDHPTRCMHGRKGSSMQEGSRLDLFQPGTHVGWYWALPSLPSRFIHSSLLGGLTYFSSASPHFPHRRWDQQRKKTQHCNKACLLYQSSLVFVHKRGKDQWTKENQ